MFFNKILNLSTLAVCGLITISCSTVRRSKVYEPSKDILTQKEDTLISMEYDRWDRSINFRLDDKRIDDNPFNSKLISILSNSPSPEVNRHVQTAQKYQTCFRSGFILTELGLIALLSLKEPSDQEITNISALTAIGMSATLFCNHKYKVYRNSAINIHNTKILKENGNTMFYLRKEF